jgi:hypothetical protein
MSTSVSTCNVPTIVSLLSSKATELSNWQSQLNGGAPVSFTMISAVNNFKSVASNLDATLFSSAGFDLGECIQMAL